MSKNNKFLITGRLLLVTFATALAVSGCFKQATKLELVVKAASNCNPDVEGRPSPIVVRVFELKSAGAFESADFFTLFDKEQATLGDSRLRSEEVVLRPGDSKTIKREASEGAQVLGVLAAYQDIDRAKWQGTYKLHQNQTNTLVITCDRLAVSIEEKKK